jgi:hypothetical protein
MLNIDPSERKGLKSPVIKLKGLYTTMLSHVGSKDNINVFFEKEL